MPSPAQQPASGPWSIFSRRRNACSVKVPFHNFGRYCTPETIDRQVHENDLARIRAWMAESMPAQGCELSDPWLPIAYWRSPTQPN